MIVLVHHNNKVISIFRNGNPVNCNDSKGLCAVFFEVAREFPDDILVWCDLEIKESVDFEAIPELMDLKRKFISYHPNVNYFSSQIGYVEESPFINVNKKVPYPTWQMSSFVGAVHTATILKFDSLFTKNNDFDFMLNSITKNYIGKGLFCYSEPKLLKGNSSVTSYKSANLYSLFSFVRQQYKLPWLFLLALNILFHEKRIVLFPFLKSLLFHRRMKCDSVVSFDSSNEEEIDLKGETIDVIIPTIGRKQYLYDVLLDLKKQTHLPESVIIVEQNPLEGSVSELNYLTEEKWPFVIKHFFIHQAGACNARNIALNQVESKWVFLNDDDNRFEPDLIEKSIKSLLNFKTDALLTTYLTANESKSYHYACQTTIYGSGNSFIHSRVLEKVRFNMALEFAYGEDTEFGLQIRKNGFDVIYDPNIEIIHLKAPMGGFRYKHVFPWDNDSIKPKPLPSILLYKKLHYTEEQVNGFKLVYFLNRLKKKNIFSLFEEFKKMNKEWETSLKWEKKLRNDLNKRTMS